MKTPSFDGRIIGAEELGDVRVFKLSEIATGTRAPVARAPAESPASDPAWKAGREAGLKEGMRLGAEAGRQQAVREQARQRAAAEGHVDAHAKKLVAALDEQFAALEHSVAAELVELALELARKIVRQALDVDREAIVAIAQDAVAALIDERSSYTVHLHPTDAAHVAEALGPMLAARNARVIPDPSITAGGCRLVSPSAEVDATVETRWQRVLASIGHEPLEPDARARR